MRTVIRSKSDYGVAVSATGKELIRLSFFV